MPITCEKCEKSRAKQTAAESQATRVRRRLGLAKDAVTRWLVTGFRSHEAEELLKEIEALKAPPGPPRKKVRS